ncbi:MAG: glucosaminidase domain-containing protein [Flavobacteriaceae bacterium]|nr:glucosaminidase domain-containing protein [Flavobacteriaceae bacterium]
MKNKLLIALVISILLSSCGTQRKYISSSDKNKTKSITQSSDQNNTVLLNSDISEHIAKIESLGTNPRSIAYLKNYATMAINEMEKYKIPASITLAQGMLESNIGRSSLAVDANNHFGIKCHKWEGAKIYHDDDEKGECFRKYKQASESFRDHSEFLTQRSRYSDLFTFKITSYKKWAEGLKKAGYATDPKYPSKLIGLIEKFELHEFDKIKLNHKDIIESKKVEAEIVVTPAVTDRLVTEVIEEIPVKEEVAEAVVQVVESISEGDSQEEVAIVQDVETVKTIVLTPKTVEVKEGVEEVEERPGVKYHIVQKGDTLYSLSKKYTISIERLKKLNSIKKFEIDLFQKLYLE